MWVNERERERKGKSAQVRGLINEQRHRRRLLGRQKRREDFSLIDLKAQPAIDTPKAHSGRILCSSNFFSRLVVRARSSSSSANREGAPNVPVFFFLQSISGPLRLTSVHHHHHYHTLHAFQRCWNSSQGSSSNENGRTLSVPITALDYMCDY